MREWKAVVFMRRNEINLQNEIDYYNPSKRIANVMLALGRLGFDFGGHGTDLASGEEDFSMDLKIGCFLLSVEMCKNANFCIIAKDIENAFEEVLFKCKKYKLSQTIVQAKRHIKLLKELQK